MKIYNTLTRKKEEFKSIDEKEIKMYVCGPTVYDYIHVGNARPLVVFDTLRRHLTYKDYDVKYVVNFTDVDDKIIDKANKEDVEFKEIADRYIKEFIKDSEGLNLYEEETCHPRVTNYLVEIVEFIKELVEKDAAYEVNGNVYFDVEKVEDYGKLSKKNIEDLISGSRVDVVEEKRNPVDFVLWKKAKEGEPSWTSPWGEGRPGWHIECSVMAKELLGDTIDIHAGGADLQFPHHENEIAQSEALTEKTFANYWMHNAMLYIDNKKMSKSDDNFFTVREISEKFDLEVLRFFLLSSHYRSPLNFSEEIMNQSKNGLDRLYNGKNNLEHLMESAKLEEMTLEEKEMKKNIEEFKKEFIMAMDDDLNTADSISSLFDIIRFTNSNFDENTSKNMIQYTHDVLMELANIVGLLNRKEEILEEDIIKLIEERSQARENKDYERSDQIRDQLEEMGIAIEDTPEGIKWRRM